jgi:hypothetical protein
MQNKRTILIALFALALMVLSGAYLWHFLRHPGALWAPKAAAPLPKAAAFAKYDYHAPAFSPKVPDYRLALGELSNLRQFEAAANRPFSPLERETLTLQHFFVAPNLDKFYDENPQADSNRDDDWTYLYGLIGGPEQTDLRRPENAVFVTTDFLLHVYHRLLEKEFESLEQRQFYPKLKKITDTLLVAVLNGYQSAGNPAQKASFQRLAAFLAVPAAILEASQDFATKELVADNHADNREAILKKLEHLQPKLPPGAYELARQELELILAASQVTPSPLLGKYQAEQGLDFPVDYSQFTPRSHYNRNPILRAYFRTMMWYSRMNFLLASPQLTRDAANLTRLLERAGLRKDWEDIYLATTFFVGESDDLGPQEYGQALSGMSAGDLSDQEIAGLQKTLKAYRKPRILSGAALGEKVLGLTKGELQAKAQGYHFMGQRFTPDAFVFAALTQGQEKPDAKTGERLPAKPTALMVMSLLGSQSASPLLADWEAKNAPASKEVLKSRMADLASYFGRLSTADWTQNIYWSWLFTLKALFQEPKDLRGYPGFMKNPEWGRKNLQAALGSWTELKHDTLLSAKQAYAEMGDGEEEQKAAPAPLGYVEPNLEFFARLIPLIKMSRDGLQQRGLLDNEFLRRNNDFLEAVEFFRKIAAAELADEPLSEGDFEKLRLLPGNLRWELSPLPGETATEDFGRAALVADVFTDIVDGQILYEGVGIPNYIYVAVKDRNGTRLTKGLVYSYYEFTAPLAERLTDEKWREWNYTGDKSRMPPLAEWSRALIK